MEIRVDRRVELLSIVFHLAPTPEYVAFDTPYKRAVDEHFGPFRDHPAVVAARELRATRGIGYNAPVGLAVFLDDATLLPQVRLDGAPELDPRWRGVAIGSFLAQVRDFAQATGAAQFFAGQHDYMAAVEQRLARALADDQIEAWFARSFTSSAPAALVIVPGLLTGPWNYEAGTHDACGRRHVYQIVELEHVDASGIPQPTYSTHELVAHEIAHSLVNPVVERHEPELVAAAQRLYDRARAEMERAHYPSTTIFIEEMVVRAVTALFARDRYGNQVASQLVRSDLELGFAWNVDLAKWLDARPRPIDLDALVPTLEQWFGAVVLPAA